MLTTPDPRQRRLGRAFDLPAAPYAVGPVVIRPYSLNAHRRADALGLYTILAGLDAAREGLTPSQFHRELDALHWLLTAPLEVVSAAFRQGPNVAWAAIQRSTLPAGAVVPFADEIGRILAMAHEALFDVVERENAEAATGLPETPPEDHIHPALTASLVLALCEKLHCTEEHATEWMPFPRVLQYMHAIRSQNPLVWTVSPRALAPDPYGEEGPKDEGFGEAIDF
jgi:hypothetical protein